uniref:Salivary thrombin inhibitor anophelin n=1 Tax=Anopheles triannulatus TaxID=58253 RepID=A0A2M3ZYB3_9DIPT
MANKLVLIGLLCVVLVAKIAQAAPQYAPGEEPSFDEDTDDTAEVVENDTSITDEDYAAIEASLSETFNTAADPGRRLGEAKP